MFLRPSFLLALAALFAMAHYIFAQPLDAESATVRVTVSINPDGSRTTYRFDNANHRATATINEKDGKLREKIRYVLDDAGHFATGEVFTADGKPRFKTIYKYDAAGLLLQELQLAEDDSVQHKIVYAYDNAGKQTGYAIYDGAGKLLGQTTPVAPQKSPPAKPKK